jgi:hypothetical protein
LINISIADILIASITVSGALLRLLKILPNTVPGDFATEIGSSFKFFFNYARGASSTHSSKKTNFAQAFGVGGRSVTDGDKSLTEESIRLAPYPYSDPRNADSASPVLP